MSTPPAPKPNPKLAGKSAGEPGGKPAAQARPATSAGTARQDELNKFNALAAQWWDLEGPMAPLHRMNPVRIEWIVERLARHFGRDPRAPDALAGLRVLDTGCGAGLASEALARRGALVTGLDGAPEALAAARAHAAAEGLDITYREGLPEVLAAEGAHFDAVLALEVIEHVADRAAFCRALATMRHPPGTKGLPPGGSPVFLSTINRTTRATLSAKFAAEYLLRWVPPGTHDWRLFVRPAELGTALRSAGLRVVDIAGMSLSLGSGWRISRDVGVNYIVMAQD